MKNKLRITIMSIIILLISIFNMLIPIRSFSELENRYLETIPNLKYEDILDGDYSSDFEKYTTDQFPFRDIWIRIKTASDLILMKKDNGRVYFGKNEFLFDVNNKVDYEKLKTNIQYINQFIEKLNTEKNLKVNLIIIPSKESIHDEHLPDYAPIIDEINLSSIIESHVSSQGEVLNLLPVLKTKKDEYIYYKTDHHWTSLGAYYSYLEIANVLGFKPLEKEAFKKELVSKDFLGSQYRKINLFNGSADEIYKYSLDKDNINSIIVNENVERNDLYDYTFLEKSDKYSFFLGGDYGLTEINTKNYNGKSLLLIKDSFSNSLVPFLTNHYEKIYMVDTRYFGGSVINFALDNEFDDIVLALNNMNIAQFNSLGSLTR